MGATRAFWFALVVYTLVMGAVLYYRPRAFFLVAEKEETDRDESDSTRSADMLMRSSMAMTRPQLRRYR